MDQGILVTGKSERTCWLLACLQGKILPRGQEYRERELMLRTLPELRAAVNNLFLLSLKEVENTIFSLRCSFAPKTRQLA